MNKRVVLVVCAWSVLIVANDFVVHVPAKKKESVSRLKESIAHTQADVVQQCAQTIEELARLQHIILNDARALMQQEKNSVFSSKDADKLEQYRAILDAVYRSCKTIQHACEASLHKRTLIVT